MHGQQRRARDGVTKPDTAALPDLLAEAKQLRDALYYAAPPNSPIEKQANRLGRVLFLIEKQVTRPYGE
jgi:hypothetical protein